MKLLLARLLSWLQRTNHRLERHQVVKEAENIVRLESIRRRRKRARRS